MKVAQFSSTCTPYAEAAGFVVLTGTSVGLIEGGTAEQPPQLSTAVVSVVAVASTGVCPDAYSWFLKNSKGAFEDSDRAPSYVASLVDVFDDVLAKPFERHPAELACRRETT
jgi:hypothetical protein